jgi:GntP family gluconate:H+ symporter
MGISVLFLILSVLLIVFLTARLRLHPLLALIIASLFYAFVTGMPLETIVNSINDGFGGTLGKIGLIVVFGIIIGTFLEKSGAALTLAENVLKLTGKKRVIPAMGLMGYLISIPVFGDSGFLLVSPLNKSLSKKAGISLAGSAIALALGLTATHTLVPPTPGPVAATGILGADVGLVVLLGVPISALALVPGLLFATRVASKTWIDPNPEEKDEDIALRMKNAPGAIKSALPVIVPMVLIILKSVGNVSGITLSPQLHEILSFVGEPVIALLIGAFLAMTLPEKLTRGMLSTEGWIGTSMKDAATILLVTGAGGAFGKILQNSGIADNLGSSLIGVRAGIWLPFLLAAAIKTAQGSSTVAMITTASLMAPMMNSIGLTSEIEKALTVLALGAGSIVVCHANDSFFWVVTQLSGMDVKTGYKLQTLGTFVLGLGAILAVFLSSVILI